MIKSIKNPVKLVLLFLVPGVLVTLAYALLASPVLNLNLTSLVVLGIAALLVMFPVELGIILYYSKKQFGVYSIKKMITYDKSLPIKKYLWLVPVVLFWTILIFVSGSKLDEFLKSTLFSWLPDWYIISVDYTNLDKGQLLVAFIFAFAVTGIILPIVEEIYFRGFLLPRMEWMGKAAPVVNAFLFSLYHFWSPWQTITRTIALIPFCYVAYKTKNIKITILIHCLLNIMGDAVILLILLLK